MTSFEKDFGAGLLGSFSELDILMTLLTLLCVNIPPIQVLEVTVSVGAPSLHPELGTAKKKMFLLY